MAVRTASLSTRAFFSFQQMRDIEDVMQCMEGVGIHIKVFRQLERHHSDGRVEKADDQYRSFMGLARLWAVVENIISIAYIDKLIAGKLVLKDRQGNQYKLVLSKANATGKPWVPPPDLEEGEDS